MFVIILSTEQVAYSTITVELAEPTPEPSVEQWYDAGVLDAFVSSVGGVVTTLRAIYRRSEVLRIFTPGPIDCDGLFPDRLSMVLTDGIVVALAYLGPYLLVFGLPVGAVGYVAYRRRSG